MSDLKGQVERSIGKRTCHYHRCTEKHYINSSEPCFTIRSCFSKNTYNLCEKAVEEILNEIEDERTLNGANL